MLLRANPQWVDVLEASYAAADDHSAWAERVCEAARTVFDAGAVVGMTALEHSASCVRMDMRLAAGVSPDMARGYAAMFAAAGPRAVRQIFYPPEPVTTHVELEPHIDADLADLMQRSRAPLGIRDCLGLVLHPKPGTAGVLFVGRDATIAIPRHARESLTRMLLHIEAGLRIRIHPQSVIAVLGVDGRALHRVEGAPDGDELAAGVKNIERARTRRHRSDLAAFDLWPALTSGRVSIVERFDGGRRCYLIVENAPATRALRAFTRGEVEVVTHAARGLSSKLIGYALGISSPRVSARLASATHKIGLATRLELVRIAAMLTRDPRSGLEDDALTAAERDVLELVGQGLTNAEIARMRSRSARTIANQVASLLRKTGSPTRRKLVTHAFSGASALRAGRPAT